MHSCLNPHLCRTHSNQWVSSLSLSTSTPTPLLPSHPPSGRQYTGRARTWLASFPAGTTGAANVSSTPSSPERCVHSADSGTSSDQCAAGCDAWDCTLRWNSCRTGSRSRAWRHDGNSRAGQSWPGPRTPDQRSTIMNDGAACKLDTRTKVDEHALNNNTHHAQLHTNPYHTHITPNCKHTSHITISCTTYNTPNCTIYTHHTQSHTIHIINTKHTPHSDTHTTSNYTHHTQLHTIQCTKYMRKFC